MNKYVGCNKWTFEPVYLQCRALLYAFSGVNIISGDVSACRIALFERPKGN